MEAPWLGRQPKHALVKKIKNYIRQLTDKYNVPRVSCGSPPGSIISLGEPTNITGHLSDLRPAPLPHYVRRPSVTDEYNRIYSSMRRNQRIYGYIRRYRPIG
jgi:hypothetical protein